MQSRYRSSQKTEIKATLSQRQVICWLQCGLILCKISVMCKLTKILLAWFLMLAIPVQGFATTSMFFCAPSHHNTVIQLVNNLPGVEHHAERFTQGAHQHDDQTQVNVAPQNNDLSTDHAGIPKIGKTEKCSASPTCCAGSVIVSIQHLNHVVMIGTELILFVQESFANYIPERIDPPPKSILA